MSLIIVRTIQLFQHPLFQGLLYSKHSNTHVWNYYSNIRTPTPCRAWSGVAERLQDLDSLCGTPMEFAECLLAFDSLCGARARVTKRLLAYYRHFWTFTRLLISLRSSNRGCQHVLTFNSLCGARMGVAKPSTISAELKQVLENVCKPSTVFAELERGLPNVY